MKIQPALPTQCTGKVKPHLQTHLRVSTVCLQDTHPKNSSPLSQEIPGLSTAPISSGLTAFPNIARAKPDFPFFTASSAVWLLLLQICWENIRSISQRSIRTLCSFLSKGRPGSSEVGGASAVSAHKEPHLGFTPAPNRLQLSEEPGEKGKQQLWHQAGADSLRDVIFYIFLLHLIPKPGWFFPYLSHHRRHFPKHLLGCSQQLWEQHKGWRGQKQGGLTFKTFFFFHHTNLWWAKLSYQLFIHQGNNIRTDFPQPRPTSPKSPA